MPLMPLASEQDKYICTLLLDTIWFIRRRSLIIVCLLKVNNTNLLHKSEMAFAYIIPTFQIILFWALKSCLWKGRGGRRRQSHSTLILTEMWLPPKNIISAQLDPLVCSYLRHVEGEWNDMLLSAEIDSQPLLSLCDGVFCRFQVKHDIHHFCRCFYSLPVHALLAWTDPDTAWAMIHSMSYTGFGQTKLLMVKAAWR